MARLEPQNELNTLRQAQAGLAAAQGQLTQARNHFERQETLLAQGWTTRANFDVATQAQQTAQSQVDAAEAQLRTAHDLVSFTELKADAPGTITATGPGAGEVVQAGQMIARLARKDGRDAVFDVPAQLLRSAPSDPQITVSLTDDPAVTAPGRIREVAAQANPVTRTFEVKVGLTDPPASHAAWGNRRRAPANRRRADHRHPGNGINEDQSATCGMDCRSIDQNGFNPKRRRLAL